MPTIALIAHDGKKDDIPLATNEASADFLLSGLLARHQLIGGETIDG